MNILRANIAATIFGGLSAILLAICVFQSVKISGFLWIDGLEDKVANLTRDNNELRAELKRISSVKNEQKVITVERIKVAERGNRQADEIAKKIEQAPVEPGACKTPDVILGADL